MTNIFARVKSFPSSTLVTFCRPSTRFRSHHNQHRNVTGIYVNPEAIIWQSFEIINKTKCCFRNFLNGKLYGCLYSKKVIITVENPVHSWILIDNHILFQHFGFYSSPLSQLIRNFLLLWILCTMHPEPNWWRITLSLFLYLTHWNILILCDG